MTNQEMVEEFHRKHGVPVAARGTIMPPERGLLRSRLMISELAEAIEALQVRDYVGLAKELADVLYVVYGTAIEAGIPLDAVFAEVHKSNMTKAVNKDKGGKVTKGPDYEPPDVVEVLTNA